jgi:hypothetical protein
VCASYTFVNKSIRDSLVDLGKSTISFSPCTCGLRSIPQPCTRTHTQNHMQIYVHISSTLEMHALSQAPVATPCASCTYRDGVGDVLEHRGVEHSDLQLGCAEGGNLCHAGQRRVLCAVALDLEVVKYVRGWGPVLQRGQRSAEGVYVGFHIHVVL